MGEVTVTASTPAESTSTTAGYTIDYLGPRKVWALQQVTSVANTNTYAAPLADAKNAVPALGGFSLRVGWDSYLPAVLDAGGAIADNLGLDYAFRFMAGRWTPASLLDAMGPGYVYTFLDGTTTYRAPKPFGPDGTPGNPTFEAAWRSLVEAAADRLLARGSHLLHCSWYSSRWSELDHGAEVRASSGYTQDAWLEGHKRLVTIARQVADARPGLVVEFPLSGRGPLTTVSPALADHMVAEFGAGTRRCVFQGNGWAWNDQWGAATPTVAAQMDACFTRPIPRALQAIQPWGSGIDFPQYDATKVDQALAQANECSANYLEIYLPTLRTANGAQVWTSPLATWIA